MTASPIMSLLWRWLLANYSIRLMGLTGLVLTGGGAGRVEAKAV